MKIWIARHGQTDLNHQKLMQGRTDALLNAKGIAQARMSRKNIGDVHFDAVYASPLQRAKLTGSIIGNVDISEVIVDPRITETAKIFPAPPSVESIDSMKERATSFLREVETKDYENVLVACHGGIMRALCGYLDEAPDGLRWERMKNCEIRVYEYKDGHHTFLKSYSLGK